MARDAPGMNNDLCGEPHRSLGGRWLPGHVADLKSAEHGFRVHRLHWPADKESAPRPGRFPAREKNPCEQGLWL